MLRKGHIYAERHDRRSRGNFLPECNFGGGARWSRSLYALLANDYWTASHSVSQFPSGAGQRIAPPRSKWEKSLPVLEVTLRLVLRRSKRRTITAQIKFSKRAWSTSSQPSSSTEIFFLRSMVNRFFSRSSREDRLPQRKNTSSSCAKCCATSLNQIRTTGFN